MIFNTAPFVRFSIAFILGIVFCHYSPNSLVFTTILLAISVAAYSILSSFKTKANQYYLSALALFILFLTGILGLKLHRLDNRADHLNTFSEPIVAYKASVLEEPNAKPNSINLRLTVEAVYTDHWQSASGKINAYVDKKVGDKIRFGDQLFVHGTPQRTEGPANPGEFDFRNYLVYNNIFHQHFVGANFEVIGNQTPWWKIPEDYAIKARRFCAQLLTERIGDRNARGVLLALTLGVKDELDNDLQASFSAAGAMHVLAVSGLHVGIIYAIFLWFFKRIKLDSWKRRWWMALASILVLWSYAFITGLSPSVLRAVTMFAFVAIAKAKNANSSIYNTLAASAFVLLCFNPYLIMSVGFQLSFLAVFGIVYLQPRFYRLIEFEGWLPDKIWEISCVSLAAQIATAPLGILYFHQFPSYFLLSNLFIIPAALVMLVLGILVLVLGGIPFLGEGLNWFTEDFVKLVNYLVHGVRKLPGSTWEGIHLTTAESWLIYAVIAMLILLFRNREFIYVCYAFVFSGLFAISQMLHWRNYQNAEMSVMNVSGQTVLDFRKGNESKLIADSSFMADADKFQFNVEPKRRLAASSLVPQNDRLSLQENSFFGNPLITFQNETFLILKDDAFLKQSFEEPIPVNYLVLSHESLWDLNELTGKIEFEQLLIDRSNRKFLADKLTNQAESLNLKVHSLYRDGYYSKLWKE